MNRGDIWLRQLFQRLSNDDFPPGDGLVDIVPQPSGPLAAVLSFTAHYVVAADVSPEWVNAQLRPWDLLAPLSPRFLLSLCGEIGAQAGSLDVVCIGTADQRVVGVLPVIEIDPGQTAHERVRRAHRYRSHVQVFSTPDETALLILGRGLAGRWEVALEVAPDHRNRGIGRALARTALTLLPDGEPLYMQTAPGNSASLRAILSAGFRPVCSEVLLLKGTSRGAADAQTLPRGG